MAKIIDYNEEFQSQLNRTVTYKEYKFSVNDNNATIKPSETDTQSDENTEIDKMISVGGWITPSEYYSNASVNNAGQITDEGYLPYGGTTPAQLKYFWVEDLKNWCIYSLDGYETTYLKQFHLCVWNGKNGWIPVDAFKLNPAWDLYNIANLQNPFFDKFENNEKIIQHRGLVQRMDDTKYGTHYFAKSIYYTGGEAEYDGLKPYYDMPTDYSPNGTFLQVVQALRLKKAVKYTINDGNNFQTIAFSSLYTDVTYNVKNYKAYYQSNFRSPVPIGAPPVWRLPTGEIALCTVLQYNNDDGLPYSFKKRHTDKAYRKYLASHMFIGDTYVWQFNLGKVEYKRILDSDALKGVNWLNSVCRKFFGTGDNKTIERDWLREYNVEVDKTEYMESSKQKISMLDTEKIFEQHDINKENSLKCSFRINRPVVTTTERLEPDYAKKW